MLATIQFDHEALLMAHEVNDVWAHRSLPAKA